MNLSEVAGVLDGEILGDAGGLQTTVDMAAASDLLSDVLSFSAEGSRTLLLTGLVNSQVIRTAEMVDIAAVCFVRGKRPDKATVELAAAKGVPVLSTRMCMYKACGRLYAAGLPTCTNC